jgi:alginate O-acetyltransferase complex protein AlgI
MLFNSLSFLIFFPIVVVGYYLLPQRFRWMWLLAASTYFYMAFIPAYILVLIYLILIDYFAAIAIGRSTGKRKKLFLIISLIANIGTLFFFKYFNFFNANVAAIASLIHWNYPIGILEVALPLGLSFHTFQSLSYVLEVYYGRYEPERHLGIYALYVMFFPQLVAGPIERPQQLLPQFHGEHPFHKDSTVQGLRIMAWGFFKKVLVADNIGVLVDGIYSNLHMAQGLSLVIGAVAFAMQLYADFSGYSDIARGSAQVMGITLVNNFDAPYFSRSIADFWRRWHISLSNWFRDYFYKPLALVLARRSQFGLYAALIITFAVIGLWHGAAWTFVFFGLTFGVYSAVGLFTKKWRDHIAERIGITRLPHLYATLQVLTTFALVCVGFIFFRSTSLSDAFYFIKNIFTGWAASAAQLKVATAGLTGAQIFSMTAASVCMLLGEYAERRFSLVEALADRSPYVRWGFYYACALVLIIIALSMGTYMPRTFIYFQF